MDTYTVYKITCLVNNKLYVGYTKGKLKYRLNGHFKKAFGADQSNIKMSNAIRKYGKINFIIEPIETFSTKEEALLFEIETITNLDTINNGYNTTIGGEGGRTSFGPLSEEHKQKIAKAIKGIKRSDETKDLISKNHADVSGDKNPMFGKTSAGSFKSGFDHPRSQPVTIDGITYGSIKIAAKTLKMAPATIKKRFLNGESS